MRLALVAAAIAALPSFALAQGSQGGAQGGRAATPPAVAQAQQPSPPSLFPCRTNEEICFVGVPLPNNQVNVLYTNHDRAEAISERPLAVTGADGGALDLSQQVGRVVMLTGEFDGKGALTRAEVIDTASPLVSFALKALLAGDDAGHDDPEPVAPSRQQQQQQQRAPAQGGGQQQPRR